MQVILLRWEVMGMPFACWNEAAADVWRGGDKDYIAIANYIHSRATWLRYAALRILHVVHWLVSKVD